jgi:diguanylate cyclase (GGDEF)-like protein/PAS domain S-box-containing protein
MERRRAPARHWREIAGAALAVASAVLFFFAVVQIERSDSAAGGDVRTLKQERVAIAYARVLRPLFADAERYRDSLALVRPQPEPGLRRQIDGEMAAVTAFAAGPGAALDLGASAQRTRAAWLAARRERHPSSAAGTARLVRAIEDLYLTVENRSGLTYDPNSDAQNLADMLFAKLPGAYNEVAHSDLIAQNAVVTGSIGIADRNELAILLTLTESDYNLTADDLPSVLANARAVSSVPSSDVLETAAAAQSYERAGDAFRALAGAGVRDRLRPLGDPAAIHARAVAALVAGTRVDYDLLALFDATLARRARIEGVHNRYLYLSAILAAIFLIGMMLFIAEARLRRERDARRQAQHLSKRLEAELAFQKAERALQLSEAQFRAIFEGAAIGIAIFDRDGKIVDANTVFRTVYGETGANALAGHEREFRELMQGERDLFEFEGRVVAPDGAEVWTVSTLSLVNDPHGISQFAICTFRDVSVLKRNERRILHDMMHDALTGLPNRLLFETKLRERFVAMKAVPDRFFATLIVDLDRFKDINESLGHDAGDFVLEHVAQRLRSAVEPDDVVSRLGSDEFALLVGPLRDIAQVEKVAVRVLAAMGTPIAIGARALFVSPSIGIAVASSAYARAEDVMRDANIAMRHAKSDGGSRFAVFDGKMHARARRRLQLTTDLRLGLERGEFFLNYQPIVSLIDGTLAGCEALIRWRQSPDRVVLPAEFMPLAEQTGLAAPIGLYVLRTACQQLGSWKRIPTVARQAFSLNVNVSAGELVDRSFERSLLETIAEFGVSPEDLTIEITETVVLDAGTRSNEIVERLRGHGFKVCIDDFGTGYSSLRYLQQFKVDSIKIDRSFVAGPDGEIASEPIVRTLMTLAESFDVRVVAEGVETQRQRDVLRNAGCRYAQGFFYSHAVAAEELEAMHPELFGTIPRRAAE